MTRISLLCVFLLLFPACSDDRGSGTPTRVECPHCKGLKEGYVRVTTTHNYMSDDETYDHYWDLRPCKVCKGSGRVSKSQKLLYNPKKSGPFRASMPR